MSTMNQLGKYQPYPDYKDSGVEWLGEIPEHWVVNRIKNITEINPPKSEVRSLPSGMDVTFLPMEAIGEKGELDISRSKQLGEVLTGYTYVTEGDVMLAKITPCFENGKAAIAKGLLNGVAFATTEVIPLRCLDNADAKFLYYLVTSDPFKSIAEGSMYGAGGQKRVADSFVAEYHFCQPSTSERIKIAAFLDYETARIDQLIAKQQQLIELLKEKRQAVISHAVTKGLNPNAPMKDSGVEWLGQVPEHWDVMKFNHCANIRNGQVDPTVKPYKDYILIAPNHIESGTGRLLELQTAEEQGADSGKYLCKKGEVIYSKIRPALAKACISPKDDVICSADMYPINGCKVLANDFLFWFLLSDCFTRFAVNQADRVAMPKINRDALGECRIPIPPIEEQKEIISTIVYKIEKLDLLIATANKAIQFIQERRTALISAAVTGKIDLRNWKVN